MVGCKMNEERFNACCDGCYYGKTCEKNTSTESGGETRTKFNNPQAKKQSKEEKCPMKYKRYYPDFFDYPEEIIEFNTLAELVPQIYVPESTKNYSLRFERIRETRIRVSLHYDRNDIWVRGYIHGTKEQLDRISTCVTIEIYQPGNKRETV
jgi:hypothetical protein